jgi:nucleotide-binding universal stress UspA family protein
MTTSIICGVDDSDGARRAAAAAADLSHRLGARLVVLHVATVPVVPGAGGVPGMRAELESRQTEAAHALVDSIANEIPQSRAERRVMLGDPVYALIAAAEETEASAIVVGSRGHGAVRAAIVGSVALELCRRAACPVLVVPTAYDAARGSERSHGS